MIIVNHATNQIFNFFHNVDFYKYK